MSGASSDTLPRPAAAVPAHDGAGVARALTFAVVFAGLLLLGLDGGGYDVVVRHQAAIFVWWAVALAALTGLAPRARPAAPGWLVLGALAGLAVWTALSLSWTPDDERTLVEVARVVAHLGVVVALVAGLGRETWSAAVAGASAAAAAIVLVALGSRLAPGTFGEDVVIDGFGTYRLSHPFGYWNAVGSWAGMTCALCPAWSAHARTGVWRGVALAMVPAAIAVTYLTYSRASLAGSALGLVVLFCASRNRVTVVLHAAVAAVGGAAAILTIRGLPEIARAGGEAGAGDVAAVLGGAGVAACAVAWLSGWAGLDRVRLPVRVGRVAFAAGGLAAIGLAAIAVSAYGDRAWDQFQDTRNVTSADPAERLQSLNGTRVELWRVARDEFRADRWRGAGAGTYEFTWNRDGTNPEFVRDAHSLYLEVLAELGIPGLLCVLALLAGAGWAFVAALRAARDPVERGALAGAAAAVSAFALGAGVDWLWESTAVTVLALVLIGCAISATASPVRRVRWRVRVPLCLGAIAACLLLLPALVSTSEVRHSQEAFARGDQAAAAAHADGAVRAQPWAASPRVQRALVAERTGDLRGARRDLRAAETRSPQDWRIPLLLARVEARRGDSRAALAAYRRARDLRPLGRFF